MPKFYRYRSHACSSRTRVYFCLDDCSLCDDAGVVVSVWGVATVALRVRVSVFACVILRDCGFRCGCVWCEFGRDVCLYVDLDTKNIL